MEEEHDENHENEQENVVSSLVRTARAQQRLIDLLIADKEALVSGMYHLYPLLYM